MRRAIRIGFIVLAAAAILVAGIFHARYFRDTRPTEIADPLEHFKYGSIGAEVDGLPYAVWRILPGLVPDRMPGGWQGFGFLFEAGHDLPVGLSVRRYGVERIGFNCATCHSNRFEGDGNILLGAPAIRLDLQRYLQFLTVLPDDSRFNADRIIAAIAADDPRFDWLDALVYRYYVIPKLRSELVKLRTRSAWMLTRPPHGPGRTDAGNSWRQNFGMKPADDALNGATDFPHIWKQRDRVQGWAHWDGNNGSLQERNLSAALAGGASPDSLDHASIERVAAWALDAPAPAFPGPIDRGAAERGRQVYREAACGACHDRGAPQFGQVTDIARIGTDRDRYDVFSAKLLENFRTVGAGYPWQFTHYRKSGGYINVPLDGIWARAPYLHNGSVPSLSDLLKPPAERLHSFHVGCARFDPVSVGLACASGPERVAGRRGNGNQGHDFGTRLPENDRHDLIEYLKTL